MPGVLIRPAVPADAELLARLGRYAEAVRAVQLSLAQESSAPERDYRERRRTAWLAEAAKEGFGS